MYYPKKTIETPTHNLSSIQQELCDVSNKNNEFKQTIYPIRNRNIIQSSNIPSFNNRTNIINISKLPLSKILTLDNKEHTDDYCNETKLFAEKEQYENLQKTLIDYKEINNQVKETIALLSERIESQL